jgi:fructoselysine-6-P-deglycase FrlB-like protein
MATPRYESYIEIFRQENALVRTLDLVRRAAAEIRDFIDSAHFEEVVFVACGSSYWVAVSAATTMTALTGVRATAVTSGELIMNPDYYRAAFSRPLVIAPSRSGTTTETLRALALLREWWDAPTLAIFELDDAPIAAAADMMLQLPWARETSICQTRSVTNLYAACVAVAAVAGNDGRLLDEMERFADGLDERMRAVEASVDSMIRELPGWSSVVSVGNGRLLGLACEGAYICIEMAQVAASYYPTLELRHGPIVMLDATSVVAMFSAGNDRGLEEDLAADCRRAGASVVAIGADRGLTGATHTFALGHAAAPEVVGLHGTVVMQALAYKKALAKRLDPDRPQRLTPWIKL